MSIIEVDKGDGNPRFKNKWCTCDGIRFQSTKEAKRYLIIKDKKLKGEIKDFKRQYVLHCIVNGVLICKYIADFIEIQHDGSFVVIDVKSPMTRKESTYIIKKKLVQALHDVFIIEA